MQATTFMTTTEQSSTSEGLAVLASGILKTDVLGRVVDGRIDVVVGGRFDVVKSGGVWSGFSTLLS